MANNAILGALRVVLGTDNTALDKGLRGATNSLTNFANGIIGHWRSIAAAVTGSAVAVAIKGMVDEADNLGKAAQKIGMPVEELSKLKHAADLSDVSMDTLGTSMGKLSRNMVEVAGGGAGPAKAAFDALGISVRNADGTLKSSSVILSEVAAKFAGYEDGAAKSALAMALFGKSGAEMIPLLNAGAGGIKEMKDEAEALGIVVDTKTAKSAEAFNDNLTRLGKVKDAVVLKITAALLPAFQSLSNGLITAAKDSQFMSDVTSGLVSFFKGVVEVALTTVVTFQRLGAEANALWQVLKAPDWASMKAAWQGYKDAAAETEKRFAGVKDFIGKFWKESAAEAEKTAEVTGKKIAAPVMAATTASENALDKYFASQAKRTAALTAQAATIGLSVAEQEKMRVALEAQAIATEKNIPLTDALRAKIEATGTAFANAAMRVQGARMTEEMLLPWQAYNNELDRNRQLFEAGAISAETYARANQVAAEKAGADWGTAGASIAGSFQQIAQSFGKESSGMAKAAKVFGIVQGTISMFTGAAKALELPFPANIAAMAAVLAKGAGLVASIKGTAVPGFMTGGSFRVGGSGGPDSQLMQFMASPGEMVDIRRPGDAGGGRGNVPTVALTLQGFAFSRDQLRTMIEGFNEMFRDGYKLEIPAA